jgi:hypothetical protein
MKILILHMVVGTILLMGVMAPPASLRFHAPHRHLKQAAH